MKRKILMTVICGCVVAALTGLQVYYYQLNQIPNKSNFSNTDYVGVDNIEETIEVEGNTLIPDQEVPLAGSNASGVKVSVKKSTSSSKKSIRLSYASSRSVIVTRKTTRKQSSSAVKAAATVEKDITTVTTQKSNYTRGSRKVSVLTKVAKTVKTTTMPKAVRTGNIKSAAKKAGAKVLSSFEDEGYKYEINTGCKYVGLFSSSNRKLTLRYQSNVIYHELGHYVAYTTGKTDSTSEFEKIYKAEKSKYTGSNKSYVVQNVHEYFAESYKDYILRKSTLKAQRPQTYAYIKSVLSNM